MLDIGWSEFLVIGVVALVVIGPKELPGALRTAGRFASKARALAQEFRDGLDEIANETELKDFERKIAGDITSDWDEAEAKAQSPIPKADEPDSKSKASSKDASKPKDADEEDLDLAEDELPDWDDPDFDDEFDEYAEEDEEPDPGQIAEPLEEIAEKKPAEDGASVEQAKAPEDEQKPEKKDERT